MGSEIFFERRKRNFISSVFEAAPQDRESKEYVKLLPIISFNIRSLKMVVVWSVADTKITLSRIWGAGLYWGGGDALEFYIGSPILNRSFAKRGRLSATDGVVWLRNGRLSLFIAIPRFGYGIPHAMIQGSPLGDSVTNRASRDNQWTNHILKSGSTNPGA
jgi:hypothetical protein